MAAAIPSSFPLHFQSTGRPGHRRSYTTNSGPGAFASLGSLPRRRQQKKTVFSLNDDDDDSPDDTHDKDTEHILKSNDPFRLSISLPADGCDDDDDIPPLRIKKSSPTEATAGVPFPRSSPLSSTPTAPLPLAEQVSPHPQRPNMTRTTSTPILLSNGKPLKSSLKSSSSSPHISSSPQPQPSNHLRARSAPSTPHLEHHVPKNVHFPTNEEGGLATVRVFNRSAKPASLSRPSGEDTETETEGELSTGSNSGFIRGSSAVFPFPRSPLGQYEKNVRCEIDTNESSSIPSKQRKPYTNVILESLAYTSKSQPGNPQGLSGTLLVRNLAYEKQVAVRFTLDDWQTTSEVSARYVASLPSLPSTFVTEQSWTYGDIAALPSSSGPDDTQWDRFGFTIKLEDYAASLTKRTMFIVARYIANASTGPVESWDNNSGKNYKIVFREASSSSHLAVPQRGRVFAVSSPPSFSPPTMSTMTATSPAPMTQPPAHAQMVAQTTLLRLKKLNLKNYAAPSSTPLPPTMVSKTTTGPASSGPVLGASSTTSWSGGNSVGAGVGQGQIMSGNGKAADVEMEIVGGFPAHVGPSFSGTSMPVVAGREEKQDKESGEGDDGEKSRSRTPSPIVTDFSTGQEYQVPGSSSLSSSTSSIPLLSFSASSSSSSAESTPPFGGSSPQTPSANIDIHRSSVLSPLDMGMSPPFSMMADLGPSLTKRRDHHDAGASSSAVSTPRVQEKKDEDESHHWPWTALTLSRDGGPKRSQEEVNKVLAGIREKSTSSPVRPGASPTNSGRSSPVKGVPGRLSPTGKDAVGGRSSPMTKNFEATNAATVFSPQPKTAGYDWSKVGSGWNRVSSGGGSGHPRASPIYFNTSQPANPTFLSSTTSTPRPLSSESSNTATLSPTSGANHQDSVYQAFVRQWCFASGPGPTTPLRGHPSQGPTGDSHRPGGERVVPEGGLVV